MPRIEFIPSNVIDTGNNFPKLKLDAQESARVVVLENPQYVYVHTLRAPEIGPDNKPVMTKAERKGEEVDVFKFKFVGRHQCLGDLNTLQEGRGVDPDNCPMCEASVKTSIVDAPQRRFGVHVAKYATKPGTHDISKPFSAQIQLWLFTEGIFNKLVGFQKEFGSLLQHDLKLGPCTSKDFQKFDINIANDAEWLKTTKTKEYIKEALDENHAEDVETEIARRKDRKWIDQDLKTVADAWKTANGAPADAAEAKAALTQDISGILGNGKVAAPVVEAVEEPVAEAPKPRKAAAKAAPAPVEVPEEDAVEEPEDVEEESDEPNTAPKSLSFNELMNNL